MKLRGKLINEIAPADFLIRQSYSASKIPPPSQKIDFLKNHRLNDYGKTNLILISFNFY